MNRFQVIYYDGESFIAEDNQIILRVEAYYDHPQKLVDYLNNGLKQGEIDEK